MKQRRDLIHWATTTHGPYKIRIYRDNSDKFCDKLWGEAANPKSINDTFTVRISADAFADRHRLLDTLIHELTHVLEAIYPSAHFSTKSVNHCTPLARTIGSGIGGMLANMYLTKPVAISQSRAKRRRRKSQRRKAA